MYSECLNCPKLGLSCDGPNFLLMPATELLKWCRNRKDSLHMSNATLAEKSGVPKGTIDRLLSPSTSAVSFSFETIRPILKVLVGEFDGNPCALPPVEANKNHEEMIEFLQSENQRLRDHVTEQRANYQKTLDQMANEHSDTAAFLRKQVISRQKWIAIVGLMLVAALSLIITALIIDMTNPDVGFFWVDTLRSIFDHVTQVMILSIL